MLHKADDEKAVAEQAPCLDVNLARLRWCEGRATGCI